jgi:heme/copper-type cytochrome/quinol oxidase subunit 2
MTTTINLILSAVIWFEVAVVLGVTGFVAVVLYYGNKPGKNPSKDPNKEKIVIARLFVGLLLPILVAIGLALYMVKDYVLTTPILTLIQGAFMAFIYYDFGPQARKSL